MFVGVGSKSWGIFHMQQGQGKGCAAKSQSSIQIFVCQASEKRMFFSLITQLHQGSISQLGHTASASHRQVTRQLQAGQACTQFFKKAFEVFQLSRIGFRSRRQRCAQAIGLGKVQQVSPQAAVMFFDGSCFLIKHMKQTVASVYAVHRANKSIVASGQP